MSHQTLAQSSITEPKNKVAQKRRVLQSPPIRKMRKPTRKSNRSGGR